MPLGGIRLGRPGTGSARLQATRPGSDLSGLALTAVPDSIGQLTNLTSLWLISNQLTAVPGSIGQLTRLTWVMLEGNRLSSPPPEVIARGPRAVAVFLRALKAEPGAEAGPAAPQAPP